jgi:predicted DNA binding CopG/RHH family protein
MNKIIDYDEEELEILDFMENGNPVSVPNVKQEIEQLKASVRAKLSKRKSINLRLLEHDLEKIKSEAIQTGIPYQTLISSILHRHVNGNYAK